ncbi:MAG: glutamate--tRNA ligase [Kiritimatiellia bacterium]|jgi:glutamyl-tRNA synthetase|nr:glutamate--tRNA ligase [Kiritimatiellia bacterium]MDP6848390.1 glutamate--tRNA ligase [Kiritimatiellia bacterium]
MTVRTRIAPSPTGAPHIGTAYIALFNYAFAKSHGGQFILRIEDTDHVRSTAESEKAILDSLNWIGLQWDEGPDVGGPKGPYRQSERSGLYQEHCMSLVEAGKAYPCFCSSERLKELRSQQMADKAQFMGYDGHCSGMSADDASKRMENGESYVIRLRVPQDGECVVQDRLRDEIRIPWNMVDDQILLKTDGFPTYHLANVVDDHLMEITHVIRGEEWISSTPKHALLYEAFGWDPPEFAHLPLLRNPDKSKLSKRKNPTSISYYQRAGILPEALLNFLGLMAYSLPDGREEFTLNDMVSSFDLDRISLGGPIFDIEKLKDFSGRYLRAMEPEQLYSRLKEWGLNETTWLKILPLARPRLEQLSDLVEMSAFLFSDRLAYDVSELINASESGERAVELLRIVQWEIEKTTCWQTDDVKQIFSLLSEKEDLKLKKLMPLFFVAFAGSSVSLPIFDSMVIMGKDMCLRRIQYALEALAEEGFALKGKGLKRFTSAYQAKYNKV